jgi:hypothetical protein
MKILKRTKGLLRFRTAEGTIVLKDGENELTDKEFELIKAHPMYEAMVGTSGLVIVAEEEKKPKAKKVEPKEEPKEEKIEDEVKEESEEVVEEAIEEDNSEDGIDLSDIDLEAQDKKTLVEIANSLEIKTKGLNAKQIIEKIKASK